MGAQGVNPAAYTKFQSIYTVFHGLGMTYAQKLKLLRVVKTGVTVLLFPHEQSITILATRVSSILKPVKTAVK